MAESGPEQRRHEIMSFEELESDPEYGPVLQEMALAFLKNHDPDYFNRYFTGELDGDGYLIRKDGGKAYTKPSQNIGGGKALERVLEMAREEIRKREL